MVVPHVMEMFFRLPFIVRLNAYRIVWGMGARKKEENQAQ